jgi:hypothetical protein
MMLEDCKAIFATVGLVGVLLFASPALGLVVHLPGGEMFSELWVLGPGHMAEDYPFNVSPDRNYLVYVDIENHMGSSAYYVLYVKFRNQTESPPNATAGLPSPLPPLYTYRAFLQDRKNWEAPLKFSFPSLSFCENRSLVGSLTINDVAFSSDQFNLWDTQNNGYYYQLFIELWIYNSESGAFQFHNRFVGIWLNMTRSM